MALLRQAAGTHPRRRPRENGRGVQGRRQEGRRQEGQRQERRRQERRRQERRRQGREEEVRQEEVGLSRRWRAFLIEAVAVEPPFHRFTRHLPRVGVLLRESFVLTASQRAARDETDEANPERGVIARCLLVETAT